MARLEKDIPDGFSHPVALPNTPDQACRWQEEVRVWWEKHPMRYDWRKRIGHEEFSREFYEEIDRRFFSSVREYMPWRRIPFDPLVDFDSLREKDVLEIGVGSGIHAQLLARCARSFTGIDLTEYAVRSTKGRLQYLGLPERILQMDAEHLEFPGGSFDFVWTWGVIHHASDTSRVLQEMHRVIRPGGRAITMVYHRSFWNYYILSGFCRGILMGDFLKSRSLHKTVQRWTDGALARFYTIPEWIALVSKYFSVEQVLVYGNKSEIIPLPAGGLKNAILRILPDQAGRFLTNDCQWGSFLVSILRKA